MQVRNTVIVEINGAKIGFKCGTLAIGIACRKSGVKKVGELFEKMAEGDLLTTLSLYYGCAVQYSNNDSLTMDQVSDWIEEMGVEKATEIQPIILEYFKKNLTAPQEGAKEDQTPTQ